jgi:hypothetical protein
MKASVYTLFGATSQARRSTETIEIDMHSIQLQNHITSQKVLLQELG